MANHLPDMARLPCGPRAAAANCCNRFTSACSAASASLPMRRARSTRRRWSRWCRIRDCGKCCERPRAWPRCFAARPAALRWAMTPRRRSWSYEQRLVLLPPALLDDTSALSAAARWGHEAAVSALPLHAVVQHGAALIADLPDAARELLVTLLPTRRGTGPGPDCRRRPSRRRAGGLAGWMLRSAAVCRPVGPCTIRRRTAAADQSASWLPAATAGWRSTP